MSDPISRIGPTVPAYPVKPILPTRKEREPGQRQNKRREKSTPEEKRDDDKPTIDEHV